LFFLILVKSYFFGSGCATATAVVSSVFYSVLFSNFNVIGANIAEYSNEIINPINGINNTIVFIGEEFHIPLKRKSVLPPLTYSTGLL
jgi:hypothetical protein